MDSPKTIKKGVDFSYRKNQIAKVHLDQHQVDILREVIAIGCRHEQTGNNVVGKHLPMVLSSIFHVDDDNLLEPESPLTENVEFRQAVNFSLRPAGPQLRHI